MARHDDKAERLLMNLGTTMRTFRKLRRKYVKRYGKRTFRRIDRYLARQSLIPNQPVLDPALFPWIADFHTRWRVIREELDMVLLHPEALPRFQDISRDQKHISRGDQWKVFVFCGFGHRSEVNCQRCPQTADLLDHVPGIQNAFFSILAPGKHIPSHHGITKGLVRCHLGLIVPENREACTMSVGGVRCSWEEGQALFFDDTYPHMVHNNTNEERVVLLFDFQRPMTRPGRIVSQSLLQLLRRTAFVQDAYRNQTTWEQRPLNGGF